MKPARPTSIIWFERLFWISAFVSFATDLDTEGSLFEIVLINAVFFGLLFLLWDLIARRASNVFKWIYSVLAFLGLGFFLLAMAAKGLGSEMLGGIFLQMTGPDLVVSAVANILSFGAAICLFLKPSQIWFRSKGAVIQNGDQLSDVFE
ncbi:hypothetical protein SAMN02745824_3276 [Parasphingorhabdus marina DSM 22363]|uniref:Uncharacterized protein n=1 Tax=Parasphingorhabdus marina DSM 22363 TaxID=1123272 RepID=A0A1N6HG88_9SPHN|nr:hypothetical protein [Parasphingorhabdus marina]SIO18831.1 hypothetical protein SAMN02745824_3276 [Parasphingorhabdus marina DSM 22363]